MIGPGNIVRTPTAHGGMKLAAGQLGRAAIFPHPRANLLAVVPTRAILQKTGISTLKRNFRLEPYPDSRPTRRFTNAEFRELQSAFLIFYWEPFRFLTAKRTLASRSRYHKSSGCQSAR